MTNKRTKIILLLLTLVLVVAMLGLVACSNETPDDDDDDGGGGVVKPIEMNFNQYMSKINTGLKGAENFANTESEYAVQSKYTVYTSTENYTLTYKAIYKENKQDGRYYIRIFDNANHVERADIYYDGKDLYVTSGQEHYAVYDFSSFLLFDVFSQAIDVLDLGHFFYGSFMQEYFDEGSLLSNVFGIEDCHHVKVDARRENVKITNGDLSILMGMFNAYIATFVENIGTSFDAVTNHYLGFRLSKFFEYRFASVLVDYINFALTDTAMTGTSIKASGRMQDNSKYFVEAEYSYDKTTTSIEEGVGVDKEYEYSSMNLGKGMYEGRVTLPTLRDTDFDVSLDYNLNSEDNKNNEFTFRIYDQRNYNATGLHKYDDINELVSVYYKDETFYINTTGLYDYVGEGVDLAAFNLPKVYIKDIDLVSLMEIFYTDAIRIIKLILDGDYRQESTLNKKTYEAVMSAIKSDVDKQEVSVTITEDLIKRIRQDETDLSVVLGEMIGLSEEEVRDIIGNDFFELMKVIITYNFGTGLFKIDVQHSDNTIALFELTGKEHIGLVFPPDLNDLNYVEFSMADVVTIEYDVTMSPYETEDVNLSEFLGIFIGDISGDNIDYHLKSGQSVRIAGKVSEYYVTNADGEKQLTTAVDIDFYNRVKKGDENVDTEILSICTNPIDTDEFLVELFINVGDYDNTSSIKYRIPRDIVSAKLDELVGGESIFTGESNMKVFLSLYQSIEGNAETYISDGYYTVSIMASDNKDPVCEFVGIKDTHAIARMKISFEMIDLSTVDADEYSTPYVNSLEDVTVRSIYSSGSAWQEKTAVYVDGRTINVKLNYTEDSTTIVTGVNEYHPVASVFGQDVSYAMYVIDQFGTYVIASLEIDNNTLVIDPSLTKKAPTSITVRYDNYETSEVECTIEGFYDNNVTPIGYNLEVFGGVYNDSTKYVLRIGKDSIAERVDEIHVAVLNRTVKPLTQTVGNEQKEIYATVNGEQMPVIARITIDPYTHAMIKRDNMEYDVVREKIMEDRIRVDFENLYGYETVIDEVTKEERQEPLYYNVQGYNWYYLSDLNLSWNYDENLISYHGGKIYAHAYVGDKYNGYATPIAIEIVIEQKEVAYVQINDENPGEYTIDYLIYSTYSVPMVSGNGNTVSVVFTDGTSRIVSLSRSSIISSEEYYRTYVYGQLSWLGIAELSGKIDINGTSGLFGTDNNATDTTTASFGGEITSPQTVSLRVVVPSRAQSIDEMRSEYIVVKYDEEGRATKSMVNLNNAKFNSVDDAYDPLKINPYDATASLSNEIYLYVDKTRGQNSPKEWKQYPITWVTTDVDGQELNIIKKEGGKFVLANPVTEEVDLVVYGRVGDAADRFIWVTMRVRNLASNIRDITLYDKNGKEFDRTTTVVIDPYKNYVDLLPVGYTALLGSGESVDNYDEEGPTGINWYAIIGAERYPIIREGKFLAGTYDGYYNDEDILIFSANGGNYGFVMYVSSGSIKNEVTIEVSVLVRTIMKLTEKANNEEKFVSHYVDIFDRGVKEGETYVNQDMAKAGYLSINYYKIESTLLQERLEELIANDGVGIGGILFAEVGEETVYAKTIVWNKIVLEAISNALLSPGSVYEFSLSGTVDQGKINETVITVKITLYKQALSHIELTRAEILLEDKVLAVKNDTDGDGRLSMTELERVTLSGYYTGSSYDKYFGTSGGYGDSIYDYVAFFNVYNNYAFSISGTKLYVSPYDYFEYVFGGISLIFESGMSSETKTQLSLGGVSEEYFNNSVLGLDENTIVEDETGKYSYSYLILEKLSEGSKVERVLVIVFSTYSEREISQITLNEEAFTEDLKELYPEGYDLPGYVEVDYRTTHGDIYTVRYGVESWLAASGSAPTLGGEPLVQIKKEYIDVISGKSYTLMFTIPDVGDNFYLIVNFPKKDIQSINYAATGYISMYDIKDGKITIDNPYLFLKQGENGKFTFDKERIPMYIDVYTNNGYYTEGQINAYNITWEWVEVNTSFDADVFTTGKEAKIAEYKFESYYHDGSRVEQIITLTVDMSKMAYSGVEAEGLDVRINDDTATNPVYNVIVIDPYDDSNGYNGRFTLPTTLTVKFNDNSQSYTFSDVKYQLYSTDGTRFIRDISFVDYNEKGHLNMPSAVTDPMTVRLKANAQGLQNVELFVTFIQRIINTVKLDNYVFDDTGEYLYELGGGGETLFDGTTPIRKKYNSYAEYVFAGPNATINGVMPVYFIDPYNTATYRLPDKVTLDFNSDVGVFGTYHIGGWQLYNEKTNVYENLSVPASASAIGTRIFYMLNVSGRSYGYYNQSASTYQGGQYLMRGYIQVGESRQTFDVLVVVLNRTLRTGVVLDDVYSVSYDFDDPISAMLSDIPCILGEQTFVDYDNYYKDFDIVGSINNSKGEFTFTVEDKYCFSQKDADGNNTNNAVLPSIVWENEYDTNGDGEIDLEFDDFTTVGYTGKIDGNVYYYSGNLNALLKYNSLAVSRAYDELVKAQMWDSFFDGDNVAGNFSTTAKNAILKAKESFDVEKIYVTYETTLGRLNEQYADYLGDDLVNITLQDLNREAILTGKFYYIDKHEDLLVIIRTLYNNLKTEYDIWVEAGSVASQRTSKTEIFSEWLVVMDEFEKSDVANNSNISKHQQLKAKYYDLLIASNGNFTTEEKNRNERDFTSLKSNLYNYINSDIWQEVYKLSNAREREALDLTLRINTITGNETLSRSLACDALRTGLEEDYQELGINGERAEADISIPVINYEAITEDKGSSAEINVISFNKINFETIEGSFVVKFKLSYKNIYEEEINDATDEITDSYREQEAQSSLELYAQKYLEEVIDAITPTEYNGATGKYEPISGMVIGTEVFGYDWLKKHVSEYGGNGTGENYYSALWLTLYKHKLNSAIYYVDSNVEDIDGYDSLADLNYVSQEEWDAIVAVYTMLLNEATDSKEIAYYNQIRLKLNQLSGREYRYEAVKELCEYIISIDSEIIRMNSILKAEVDKKYASLSGLLLTHAYTSTTNIGGAMAYYSGDSSDYGIKLGGARMFAITYDKADLPGLSEFDLASTLHKMLNAHYKDASVIGYDDWSEIAYDFSEDVYYDYEGIRCFIALNTAGTQSVAKTYYDYLLGYVASDVSPYDMLCDNGYMLASGINRNYLESINNGGLLAYVTLTDDQTRALNAIKEDISINYETLEKQLRRSFVYSAVKSVAEAQALVYFNEWEEEALRSTRAILIDQLMELLKDRNVNSYGRLNTQLNGMGSSEKLAFAELIEQEIEKGKEIEREYLSIVGEYNERILEDNSITILEGIYNAYTEYNSALQSGYTGTGYIYNRLYGNYVKNRGYLTIDDNSDDYVWDNIGENIRDKYAIQIANTLKVKYELSSIQENKILNSYVKDLTLRAYVRYFDKIATTAQKTVLAEVISMHLGKAIDINKSLEETLIKQLSNNEVAIVNFGKTIYDDISKRHDIGKDYIDGIAKAYGYIYLADMLGGIELYVYGSLEVSTDNSYITPSKEYGKILNALGISNANETVDLISKSVSKDKIWQSVHTINGGYDSQVNALYGVELSRAYAYAYDVMYNKQNEDNEYLHKDALNRVLEDLVYNKVTDEFYQDVFEKIEQILVEEKLSSVISATEKAVNTILYGELYQEIKLLDIDKNEFAKIMYSYLTGEEGTAQDLLGENLDAAGGLLGKLTTAIENGTLENSEELVAINEKAKDWWTKSAYGEIGEIEQEFLYQIYLQNYYQINNGKIDVETRNKLATIGSIYSIYLFHGDLSEYIRDNMPSDYFSENNVDEYRYYVMNSLYESEVMNMPGHSLTLAKAYLVDRAENYIGDVASKFDSMVSGNIDANVCDSAVEYVEFIARAIYYNDCAPIGTDEEKEEQRALYNKYLDKVKEYFGYTSASSSEEYRQITKDLKEESNILIKEAQDEVNDILEILKTATGQEEIDALAALQEAEKELEKAKRKFDETNTIYIYVNKIYVKIVGYAIGSDYMQGNGTYNEFGLLSTRYYYEKVGKDYKLAIEEMLEERMVYETFYSEDSFDSSDEDQARHVIYFDRTTWEEFVAGGSVSAAPGTLDNQNVYFANSLKTEKVDKGKDKDGNSNGYYYANSFKADDIKFVISDISRIDLQFEGEEHANTLSIDAIAPYLPMKAKATGYIDISESNSLELDLGEISITEYSEAFNELIYKEKTIVNDDAYYVYVKALNNTTMKVTLNVNYLNRSIEGMYVKSDNYSGDNLLINDASDPFSNYYPIYNDLVNKNVIYMQATNTDILNETKGEYILPESIGVRYGNGDNAVFSNVTWDSKGITYDIKGTQGKYINIRILSYEYDDNDGNNRLISYDYDLNTVNMKIYDGFSGALIGEEQYQLSSADMIDWRVALFVEDMTIRSVSYYKAELGDFVELGQYNEVTQFIDASMSDYVLNPYMAEYPERLRISFASGSNEEVILTQKDWALASNNALINLINVDVKDAVDQGRILTYFKYLGYNVAVKFDTMDIRLPKAVTDEMGNTQYIEGGMLYLIRNQSSASIQLNEFYSTMYYNFGEGKQINWQKVPLAFDNTDISDVSITQPGLYENVIGTLGVTRSGALDKNIVFDIQVIDLRSYADNESGYNPYVTYDYYSIPRDNNNNRRGEADEPTSMADYFIHREETGDVYFNIDVEKTFYDFISGAVEVSLTYAMDASVDERIAHDATGSRTRELVYNVPMKSYVYSSVGEVKYNKNEAGKKWTWTKIPVTNAQYVDAIYWPIGQPMKASDMPTIIDEASGEEISLLWDLNEVNVNRANEEGYTVYGSYLTSNNTWTTLMLIVYIDKIDVTENIINLVNGEDGMYIEKVYDATFFKLNFQAELLEYLREDGSVAALDASEYKIHYLDVKDTEGRWREGVYPINAGTYYVRISFDDYNVFLDTGEDWTFMLTITPYEVDLNKIRFVNQDDAGASVTITYNGGRQGITVKPDSTDEDDNGIPSMVIDGWFGTNEKQLLVADYKLKGYSTTEATARAYMDIYNRVSTRMQAKMVGWYDEVKATGNYATDSAIKEYVYNVYMQDGMTIEEATVNVSYRYNGLPVAYPTNVGTYSAIVTISDPDGNYTGIGERAISLTINKNETLVYGFNETIITYNGMAQNPEISDLHVNGAIPEGVTVTYTYVKGEDKLVIINESNNVSIDQGASSGNFTLRGIKDVGTYNVNVVVDGGNNYIDGQFDAIVQIRKASIYINVEEIKALYLDEVKNVQDYVKIYSDDHGDGSKDMLRGTDRLSDFGNLFITTPVESYYPIGEYYTFINGFRLDENSDVTYTQKGSNVSFEGETYVMLTLKGGTSEGSLYKYVDEDGNYIYADIINLFNNYYVYARSHDYDGDGANTESGKYIITNEEGAIGVDGNEEMAEFIASLKDGDTAIVYAQPIVDGITGEYAPYEPITINADVNLTIVGYYDTETAELSTLLKSVTVVKGTLTLKIVKVVISENGASGITARDKAGIVRVYDSIIETVGGAKNTIGIATTLNYGGRIFAEGTTFVANNVGIDLVSGEIEISNCSFEQNYIGMSITSTSNSIRIIESTFNGQNIAIKSSSSTISVLYSTFAYNKVAIEIPIVTNVDMRINNTFTNTNGENFVETNE